jgi:hypothetical protein
MDEKEIQSLPLKLAYGFLQANGLATEAANIRASKAKLGSYDTTLKRAMVLSELTRNGLLDRFIAEKWTYGASPAGQTHVRRLKKIYGRYQESVGHTNGETAPEDDEPEQGNAFAYEEHLRDYLAHPDRRSTAFGIFDSAFGVAWFVGSAIMGLLYGKSILALVLFSVVLQLLALPFLAFANKEKASE